MLLTRAGGEWILGAIIAYFLQVELSHDLHNTVTESRTKKPQAFVAFMTKLITLLSGFSLFSAYFPSWTSVFSTPLIPVLISIGVPILLSGVLPAVGAEPRGMKNMSLWITFLALFKRITTLVDSSTFSSQAVETIVPWITPLPDLATNTGNALKVLFQPFLQIREVIYLYD